MSRNYVKSWLRFELEKIDREKFQLGVGIVGEDLIVAQVNRDDCLFEVLPGSVIRGKSQQDDIPFSKTTRCSGTIQDVQQLCMFVEQCCAREDDGYELTTEDYNNLACAYIWCLAEDNEFPNYAKAHAAFLRARKKATNTHLQNIIDHNLSMLPKRLPFSIPTIRSANQQRIIEAVAAVEAGEVPGTRMLFKHEIENLL